MSVATDLQTVVVTTVVESDSVSTAVDTQSTVVVQTAGGDTVVTELQGPRGLSAYEIAVKDGFVGTEAEWLASLQGTGGGGGTGVTDTFACVASEAISAGMPVVVDRTSAQLVHADADWKPHAFVAGLAAADVGATSAGTVATASLTLADWTAATGSPLLAVGQVYFLASGGGLTTVAPATCLAIVGTAISTNTLEINPQPPLQL